MIREVSDLFLFSTQALLGLFSLRASGVALAAPSSPVAWEIHQAFPAWVEGESFCLFAKVTNIGTEILPLSAACTLSDVEQTVLIPQWKEGQHYHWNVLPSNSYLPQVDAPWKSRLDWRDTPLHMLEEFYSRALMPGQSEVLGDLELRELFPNYAMPNPHMEGFQLALRLGPDRYALSEPQPLVFADIPKLEAHPVLQEIEVAGNYTFPLRRIKIEKAEWLFFSHIRIARVPEGATPKFRTEDEKQVLVVEFEGVVEEPVHVDVRQGFPLSGSIRTVPHLHLWRSLTNRSMDECFGTAGGFYKETGLTLAKARSLKWDGTDPELQAQPATHAKPQPQPNGKATQNEPSAPQADSKPPIWPWILGLLLVTGAGIFFKKWKRSG
jgi:hypothetical protein